MSVSTEVREDILHFCIKNAIPPEKTVGLLRDVIDSMNGDSESEDFTWVYDAYKKIGADEKAKAMETIFQAAQRLAELCQSGKKVSFNNDHDEAEGEKISLALKLIK